MFPFYGITTQSHERSAGDRDARRKVRMLAAPNRLLARLLTVVTLMMSTANPAMAGDLWHGDGTGDCWRGNTPYVCRVGWSGANTLFTVYMIDQIGSPPGAYELRLAAQQAATGWTGAPGPQILSWSASSAPTWMYVRADYTGGYGSASALQYSNSGNIMGRSSVGAIWYTIVRVDPSNWNHPKRQGIFAHEYGHGLGLYEHGNENVGVMWPYSSDANYQTPTSFDIGPTPPCSGITNSYLGVRCIYNYGN
jgi:hypothetical protein